MKRTEAVERTLKRRRVSYEKMWADIDKLKTKEFDDRIRKFIYANKLVKFENHVINNADTFEYRGGDLADEYNRIAKEIEAVIEDLDVRKNFEDYKGIILMNILSK